MESLLDAGADEVLLASDRLTAVAWSDGGRQGEREQRYLADFAVIVQLEPATGATRVDVDGQGTPELRDRVFEALADFGTLLDAAEPTRTTS